MKLKKRIILPIATAVTLYVGACIDDSIELSRSTELSNLKNKFKEIATTVRPERPYALQLDYGGQLDRITKERNQFARENGGFYTGEWMASLEGRRADDVPRVDTLGWIVVYNPFKNN